MTLDEFRDEVASNKVPLHYTRPPGYVPTEALMAMQSGQAGAIELRTPDVEIQKNAGNLFAGNPDTVVNQIKTFYDRVGGVGHLILMGHGGFMTGAEASKHLKLLGNEVLPQLQDLTPPEPAAA